MGTMREAGAPLLMSLRLRIRLGRITEIESIYFRHGGGGPNNIADMDKPYKPEDIWFKSIPPSQRMSRQELIAVADAILPGCRKMTGRGSTAPERIHSPRIVTGSKRISHDQRSAATQYSPQYNQLFLDGLHVAVQIGAYICSPEHPQSPIPGCGPGARNRLCPLRI